MLTIFSNLQYEIFLQEYKPPCSQDIPEVFNTKLYNSNVDRLSPYGVLSSKATGEPVLLVCFSHMVAVRRAIDEAKRDKGEEVTFYDFREFD